MVAMTVRTFYFKSFLILIWAVCRFMRACASNAFLVIYTVFGYMVKALTFITLCNSWGSPITFTPNTNSAKIDPIE